MTLVKRFACCLGAALLLLAVARPARSEVTIALSLDRSEATLADSLMLSVSVSGAHGDNARPTIAGLEDFLVRPAGTSTRVEIINGAYSAGTDFSYLVQPKKAGSFRIGPAQLTVGGTTYRSNVATVTVGQPVASPDGDRGPVFLMATLAPAKVYVEQQALYTLKLYRSVNIADASVNVPEVAGVAFVKLGEPREYQGVHQGRPYQVIEVRYLVTPQRAGNFTLTPTRMDLTVFTQQNRPRRGIFDDPFFGQMRSGRPVSLASEALALQVLPVPNEGRPADYSGLVGSFTLESKLEPQELKAGESVTLTAIVRGRGNGKRIPELKIPPLDGLKTYADQPVLKDESDGEGVVVSKTMKWALVPEKAGRYRVPALTMGYFDTAAGRYRTLKTAEATLVVAPGSIDRTTSAPARPAGAAAQSQPKRAVAELGNDILPIHTASAGPASTLSALPGGAVFWLLLLAPPAAFFLALGSVVFRRSSGSLSLAMSVRRAYAGLAGTCKRGGLTADELMQALQDYASQRLSLARGSLTADEAVALLRSRNVDAATADKLHVLWRELEDAIYTGKGRETTGAGPKFSSLLARVEKDLR
ncbi:MAG: BatD family protein [Candidatus Methylomirabilia bacterium]